MSRPAERRFDVLGLGCVAVDDLIYVPAYPPSDEKIRVTRAARQCGGLTGNALLAAARLGGKCAFAGCLGTDWLSNYVAGHFAREKIDISHAPRLTEGCVVHSIVVVGEDNGSRNIFYQVEGLLGAHPVLPSEDILLQARVLIIDDYGVEGNLRAAKLARKEGVGIVADFEQASGPHFAEVLDLVDHLILSEKAALKLAGTCSPAAAATALWRETRETVIVTCGGNGCWSVGKECAAKPRHYPAFPVETVDTTGCGDVFHGAYALSLARGEILEARIRYASGAAACKAANAAIPSAAELDLFLQSQSPWRHSS